MFTDIWLWLTSPVEINRSLMVAQSIIFGFGFGMMFNLGRFLTTQSWVGLLKVIRHDIFNEFYSKQPEATGLLLERLDRIITKNTGGKNA